MRRLKLNKAGGSMAAAGTSAGTFTNILLTVAALLTLPACESLNLGLIAGDSRRVSSPLTINKLSKHSPIFINIRSGFSKPPLSLPKPPKPPPLKLLDKPKPPKKLPRSILAPLPKIPLLPILPLLPPIIPFLPPILPKLPLLPILPPCPLLPTLTILPKLKSLEPLRVPILKKSEPLKPLRPDLKIAELVPPPNIDIKAEILKKLLDLKKKGSLTTAEFFKFKKLLLK